MPSSLFEHVLFVILQSREEKNNIAKHNEILDNDRYGINAERNVYSIDATDNWWGDASGPYHPSTNPSGNGDEVTDNVEFYPWEEKYEIFGINEYSLLIFCCTTIILVEVIEVVHRRRRVMLSAKGSKKANLK